MKTRLGTIGAVVLVAFIHLLSALPALGDAILASDNRSVKTSGSWHIFTTSGSWNVSDSPTPAFNTFNSIATAPPSSGDMLRDVFASQISTVTPTLFQATGTVHINVGMNVTNCSSGGCTMSGSAASIFEVAFTLSDPQTYQLSTSGSLTQLYLEQVGIGKIPGFPSTGTLNPGSYIFHADAQGSFGELNAETYRTDLNYSLSFQMQPAATPEPSSLISLGIGLGFVAVKFGLRKLGSSRE
jgi:hypothetical protein